MRIERIDWDGEAPAALAARARATAEPPPELEARVAEIVDAVRFGGDAALRDLTATFDATERLPERLRVDDDSLDEALGRVDPALRAALVVASENIAAVASAELAREPVDATLPQGQNVKVARTPVASAGVYAPGGRAAYPSSVLMGVIPARVAGVERVVLVSPPDARGEMSDVVLAAARIAGATEVHAAGGAQAIAALAYGTESIDPVDVIAGPGNAWVTEAKRRLYGTVGIDALAGPSELVVVADASADPHEIALDCLAQAEHGPDSPIVVIANDGALLDAVERELSGLAPGMPSVSPAPATLVTAPSLVAAVALSDAFAPEHLELRFEGAERTAADRIAGAVFVGPAGATAFGDYAAGSNHVLPTGGAARFSGPLGVDAFLPRTAVVTMPREAADQLAPVVDRIAVAEGLPVHGESARVRSSGENG